MLCRSTYLVHFLLLISNLAAGQGRISGFVREVVTGESIPYANIAIDSTSLGTSSNAFGFYSLFTPRRPTILRVSAVGYTTQNLHLNFQNDSVVHVVLTPSPTILEELTLSADEYLTSETDALSRINSSLVKNTPVLLGEKDILKTLQLLPGVQFGTEGSNALYVRGGTPDQNLIILDDAPVYNASHLFGFFSVFNADAITNVIFLKSGFPAQYGGRVSSITDLRMKEGNKERLAGEAGIGILSSRLTLEGPLESGKSSFMISGRRSFLDLLIAPFLSDQEATYRFYDLNTKVNFELDKKNKLYASVYTGNDKMHLSDSENISSSITHSSTTLGWGNLITTLRWSHIFNPQMFTNTTVYSSHFKFNLSDELKKSDPSPQYQISKYQSHITDYGIKTDFDYFLNNKHTIKAGYVYTYHQYEPKAFQYQDRALAIQENSREQYQNHEIGVYFEDQWAPISNLDVRLGGRYNFLVAPHKTFTMLEPRVQLSYSFHESFSILTSFMRVNQFVHLLSTTGVGLATDLWVPVTERVPPTQSDHISVRLLKILPGKKIKISFETYRKYLHNIINYTDDASFLVISEAPKNISWEDNITTGKGTSFGSEFLIEKTGRLSGWVAYTLSWNVHRFGELNNGKAFYAKYDNRHVVSTNTSYRLSNKISIGLTWSYRSGSALNAPQGYYFTNTTNFSQDIVYTNSVPYYGARNSFRTEAYHRLDVAAQFHRKKRKYERFWEVSIFNAYNRKNPFYYYLKSENTDGGQRIILKKRALFPILPSVSYTIKF